MSGRSTLALQWQHCFVSIPEVINLTCKGVWPNMIPLIWSSHCYTIILANMMMSDICDCSDIWSQLWRLVWRSESPITNLLTCYRILSTMLLAMRLGICFLLSINLVMSRDYTQEIDMMKGGKMVLNWEVEDNVLFFKLSGQTKGFVGLAFASEEDPDDGFIAGVDKQGQGYIVDLHLDHTSMKTLYLSLSYSILFNF